MENSSPKFDRHGNQITTAQYSFIRKIGEFLHKFIFPIKAHGVENLEKLNPPYIIIANHKSLLDPIAVAVNLKKYPIHFLGKKELVKNKFISRIFEKLYMISIDRKNSDIKAVRQCLSVLKSGGILGIFPEGTRHKDGFMQQPESGTSLLVLRSGVPVIPVLILGKLRLFKTTNIYYGEPIEYTDILEQGINAQTCNIFTERMKIYYENLVKKL